MRRSAPQSLVCSRCGRRVSWSGRRGRYVHSGGGPVAACDLDAEHPAEPDWDALGELSCVVCGTAVVASDGRFSHRGASSGRAHPADPGFPVSPGA